MFMCVIVYSGFIREDGCKCIWVCTSLCMMIQKVALKTFVLILQHLGCMSENHVDNSTKTKSKWCSFKNLVIGSLAAE